MDRDVEDLKIGAGCGYERAEIVSEYRGDPDAGLWGWRLGDNTHMLEVLKDWEGGSKDSVEERW